MTRTSWDRVAAASGILFVGLYVLAAVLAARGIPSLSDPNGDWVNWVDGHRRSLKVAAMVTGLAIFVFLWFVGSVSDALRRRGEERLAGVALASGGATAAVALVGVSLVAVLAQRVTADSPGLTKSVWEIQVVIFTLINFVGGALMYTTAAAAWRSGVFPRWYGWLVSLGALAVLFDGGALAYKGFYAPDGGYGLVTTVVFMAWVLLTSILLRRGTRQVGTPAG